MGDPTGARAEKKEKRRRLPSSDQRSSKKLKLFSSCDAYASEAYSCAGPEAEVVL
ncbi:hypothetical protein [Bacillus sp. FJAT-27225]|uniref:hypothetical protein n=1 Tax=Bacillus sp. FJAT-27225 TaxID=1743144 RepID=UPI001586754E|nr:hypothetical protein [Bacillus sp. FJAT-27225]